MLYVPSTANMDDSVFAVAYRVLGDRGLAEEATEQTFLKAWPAAASFDAERELGPWLVAIARRVAIDVSRRETVRAADPLDAVAPGHPALSSSPEALEAVYDVWEVRGAVAELPPEEQDVVRLQHFKGYTDVEIAERLDLRKGRSGPGRSGPTNGWPPSRPSAGRMRNRMFSAFVMTHGGAHRLSAASPDDKEPC